MVCDTELKATPVPILLSTAGPEYGPALPVNSPPHSESQTLGLRRLQEVAPNNDHPPFASEPPALSWARVTWGSGSSGSGLASNQYPVRAMAMLTRQTTLDFTPAQPQKRQLISKQNLCFWLIQFALTRFIPSYLPTLLLPSRGFYVKCLLATLQGGR